jgi:hypothetical protein
LHFVTNEANSSSNSRPQQIRKRVWIASTNEANLIEASTNKASTNEANRWEVRDLAGNFIRHFPEGEKILAAPWLIVADKKGRVRYAGGYDPPPAFSTRILEELSAGREVHRKPVRGCATQSTNKLSGLF